MIYINAFILCGFICGIGQIIIDNTNLTPGHLNTLLVVIGAVLSFFGIYEFLIFWGGAGATVPITNFGHLLFKGAYEGFMKDGITGLFTNFLSNSSGVLTITIIMAFLVSIFSKPQH